MISKELAQSFARDSEVALIHDEAEMIFSGLDKSKEITNDDKKIQGDD